ncbi:MAG TPA: hypothetical protein VH877_21370, partial [Polyangia bacterium]|nr:hypothetical protein [Polyangia bacterium]
TARALSVTARALSVTAHAPDVTAHAPGVTIRLAGATAQAQEATADALTAPLHVRATARNATAPPLIGCARSAPSALGVTAACRGGTRGALRADPSVA